MKQKTQKTKKKKNNNGRVGGTWERMCARLLSEWVTEKKDELIFWRAAGSGSVNTIATRKGIKFRESGDFRCTDLKYQFFTDLFHIDAKSMKEVNFFIYSSNIKSSNLFREWRKVVEQATAQNKIPLMPVQFRGGKLQFIVVPEGIDFNYVTCLRYDLSNGNTGTNKTYYTGCFTLIPLQEFFQENKAIDFYRMNTQEMEVTLE